MHKIDQELNFMLRGQFDEAWKISEELEAMGPDGIPDPANKPNSDMWLRHSFNRGWFLLQQKKFREGFELLEAGRFLNVYGSGKLQTDKPLWDGSDPTGKTIILSLEGGLGDEIIHVRFAKKISELGATVIVAAAPPMTEIFKRVPGVSKVITRSKEDIEANPHDFWIPGFSAGWVSGHDFTDLYSEPYLIPSTDSVEIWKNLTKTDKIKIGIRWSGNPQFEHQQFRNFPPEFLVDLAKHDELQIYSFQRDNDTRELPDNIVDFQYLLISWEDTLAALSHMDLVITSCTSIAHAAAAMGKPTWVLTPILPYHTWAYGAPEENISPWYPTVTLYRQQKFGTWTGTFKTLYTDLKEKFDLEKDLTNELFEDTIKEVPYVEIIKEKYQEETKEMNETLTNQENKDYDLFFMAGLPNSGGNVIMEVLGQNPDFHISRKSDLHNVVSTLLLEWTKFEQQDPDIKKHVLSTVLMSYFKGKGTKFAVDKNRFWVNKIPLIESVTGKKAKILVPVRNPAEILSVYELNRLKNVYSPSPADRKLKDSGSIASRCYFYSKPEGILGMAHAQTMDAVTAGYRDRLLFIDYNKFCNEPKSQLARIYDFLEIKQEFQHDTSKIRRHMVTPVDVIGFDLFNQYNAQIFWQNWV